jgi:UDPglucose 6-dehydrogenase
MNKVGVIGAGYIGLVTAACFAELGNKVICVDNDRDKIEKLKKGISPIYEPGLDKLLKKNVEGQRLRFSHSIREATQASKIVFICVGTPASATGSADLSAVASVASEIAKSMTRHVVIVGKSTVPAQTGQRIKETVAQIVGKKVPFDIVSNPEFLREGRAIKDTLKPDRIIIGVESKRAERIMRDLYKPIRAPLLVTDIASAEIIKHASNSFLSTKISFINAVAAICERIGADVKQVADGMGMDKRIGRTFLDAGVGFGGYCFPKDLDAFISFADMKGYDFELLKAVRKINEGQKRALMKKLEEALWIIKDRTVAVLGLSFKPETDDIRNSIAIELVRTLQAQGAHVKAFDPKAMDKAGSELSDVTFCRDLYDAARDADGLMLVTEWKQFGQMDLRKIKKLMRHPIFIDGRNLFDPKAMKKLGFIYRCVGRPDAV